MKRVVRWLPVIVLLVFVGAALLYSESLKARVQVGAAAPSFELPALDGGTVRLDDFRGRPVIINFWAAWCPPCLEEMPAHDEFYRRYGDRIVYLAVNQRETVARIQRHLDEVKEAGLTMTLPILLDRRGSVGEAFRLGGMPETWVIDPQGIARRHWIGPVTFEQLQAGYWEATGRFIDEADGGPFHGRGAARAVLAVPGAGGGPARVYIGGEGGLARYDLAEGGAPAPDFVWEAVDGETVTALARLSGGAAAPGTDAAAGDDALLVVTDKGLEGLPAAPVALAQDASGTMLAWVPWHGLYERSPAGTGGTDTAADAAGGPGPWREVAAELSPQMPWAGLDPDPFTPGRWLLAGGGGLLESRDGGRTWRATGVTVRSYAVRHDPVTPRRVYIATDTGIWLSEDGGRTAQRVPGSPQRQLAALDAVQAPGGGVLLTAAAPNGDVYVSTDAGATWRLIVPLLDM